MRLSTLARLLRRMCRPNRRKCRSTGYIVFAIGPAVERVGRVFPTPWYRSVRCLRGDLTVAKSITATQEFLLSVAFKNRLGGEATVDGPPTWLTDNTAILALKPSTDGLSCLVTAVGMVGTANVQMTADADLGEGVKPLIGTFAVTVTPGEAAEVVLTDLPATEQP